MSEFSLKYSSMRLFLEGFSIKLYRIGGELLHVISQVFTKPYRATSCVKIKCWIINNTNNNIVLSTHDIGLIHH